MSRNLKVKSAIAGAVVLPQMASAALPQAQTPTRGEGSNILQTIQNWGFDGFMLIGLLILGVMFLGVAWHAFGVYHEIHGGCGHFGCRHLSGNQSHRHPLKSACHGRHSGRRHLEFLTSATEQPAGCDGRPHC